MGVFVTVKKRFYQDSLKLMRVSDDMRSFGGVKQAFAFMGTEINKTTRIPAELLTGDAAAAGADDLILLVECDSAEIAETALAEFGKKMTVNLVSSSNDGYSGNRLPFTLDDAFADFPDSNLAVISVPGGYAAAQAMRALQLGLNVHLFSDNVSLDDEIRLKKFAVEKGLLLMGPDCGTAMLGGTPLCFANNLRRGGIGIVAASGTGAQEVSCIIDALGGGVSHIIGVGGRDLSEGVGGLMTLHAVKLLADDTETKVIAIVSKPPAKSVADKVLEAVQSANKPAVMIFMGYESDGPVFAASLEEGAAKAVTLLNGKDIKQAPKTAFERGPVTPVPFKPGQKYIRGFYTGGTLASEAAYILEKNGAADFSIIDLGGDEYTLGKLHPMIDPSNRAIHVAEAVKDPSCAVILCDVVIGHGSHANPAEELAKAVRNTGACVLASVTGTDSDPQNKSEQERILQDAGIMVFPSNQSAAEAAAALILKEAR